MTVTKKITMDVNRTGIPPLLYAMQGDQYSRHIEITLTCDGASWEPPEGVTVQAGYTRADGTQWTYTKLPDGNQAYSIEGNIINLTVAPQVLSRPGKIPMTVTLISGDTQISTFPIMLQVTARPGYVSGAESGGVEEMTLEKYINDLIDEKLADLPAIPTYTGEVEVE